MTINFSSNFYPSMANNNTYQNRQGADRAILGAFKAFGIRPTGNKGADMMKLIGGMLQGSVQGFNRQQEQSIGRLMDQLQIPKTGDKNKDFLKLIGGLIQGGQNQQQNNIGGMMPPMPPPPPDINNMFNNQVSQGQNNVDHAILGAFKAFGIRPTGNKGADMMKLIGGMLQGSVQGFNRQQEQSIGRLMDQLQIPKTGDKNKDFLKLLGGLIQGGQNQQDTSSYFN